MATTTVTLPTVSLSLPQPRATPLHQADEASSRPLASSHSQQTSLSLVFQFLRPPDLLACVRTSSRWYSAVCSPLTFRGAMRLCVSDTPLIGIVTATLLAGGTGGDFAIGSTEKQLMAPRILDARQLLVQGPACTFTRAATMRLAAASQLFRHFPILTLRCDIYDEASEMLQLLERFHSVCALTLDFPYGPPSPVPPLATFTSLAHLRYLAVSDRCCRILSACTEWPYVTHLRVALQQPPGSDVEEGPSADLFVERFPQLRVLHIQRVTARILRNKRGQIVSTKYVDVPISCELTWLRGIQGVGTRIHELQAKSPSRLASFDEILHRFELTWVQLSRWLNHAPLDPRLPFLRALTLRPKALPNFRRLADSTQDQTKFGVALRTSLFTICPHLTRLFLKVSENSRDLMLKNQMLPPIETLQLAPVDSNSARESLLAGSSTPIEVLHFALAPDDAAQFCLDYLRQPSITPRYGALTTLVCQAQHTHDTDWAEFFQHTPLLTSLTLEWLLLTDCEAFWHLPRLRTFRSSQWHTGCFAVPTEAIHEMCTRTFPSLVDAMFIVSNPDHLPSFAWVDQLAHFTRALTAAVTTRGGQLHLIRNDGQTASQYAQIDDFLAHEDDRLARILANLARTAAADATAATTAASSAAHDEPPGSSLVQEV